VVAARAVALAGAGIGWWALVPSRQPGPSAFVLLRFVREGINAFFHGAIAARFDHKRLGPSVRMLVQRTNFAQLLPFL